MQAAMQRKATTAVDEEKRQMDIRGIIVLVLAVGGLILGIIAKAL